MRPHMAHPRPLPLGVPLGQFHERHAPWGYPTPRKAEGLAAGYSAEKYYRMESSGAEITVADADAIVFTFSGYPDKIHMHSRTNAALVRVTDRFTGESDEIIINPNNPADVFLPRNVVIARNLTAGSAALLFVEGYYLAPVYHADAR
jgi:hypothetical protein